MPSGISEAVSMIKQREEIKDGAPLAINVRMRAGRRSVPGGAIMRAMGTSRRQKIYAASHADRSVRVERGTEILRSRLDHPPPLSRAASSKDRGIIIKPASDSLVVT